jgi:hypothetical protein
MLWRAGICVQFLFLFVQVRVITGWKGSSRRCVWILDISTETEASKQQSGVVK